MGAYIASGRRHGFLSARTACQYADDGFVIVGRMRIYAILAVFYPLLAAVLEIAAASVAHGIERAVAKQAVERACIGRRVAWEIFTFCVLKKFVGVFHDLPFSSKRWLIHPLASAIFLRNRRSLRYLITFSLNKKRPDHRTKNAFSMAGLYAKKLRPPTYKAPYPVRRC